MRVRINYGLADVPGRLAEWGHPYAADWDTKALSMCLVLQVVHRNEHDVDEIVGYVWLHWLNHWAKQLEMHICIHPKYQRRWYTRRSRKDIFEAARLCDAHYLIARDNAKPFQADLLQRAGFTFEHTPQWWAHPIPENH